MMHDPPIKPSFYSVLGVVNFASTFSCCEQNNECDALESLAFKAIKAYLVTYIVEFVTSKPTKTSGIVPTDRTLFGIKT